MENKFSSQVDNQAPAAGPAREWTLHRFKDDKNQVSGWFVGNEPQWRPGPSDEMVRVREVTEAPALPKGEARSTWDDAVRGVAKAIMEGEAPPSSPSPDQDWPPPPEVELVSRLQGMLTRVGFSSNPQDYQKVLLEVNTILAKEAGGGR